MTKEDLCVNSYSWL